MMSLVLLALLAGPAGPRHFEVTATFVPPARPGADGAIAVRFVPLDPDVHVNEEPAPRLKLDLGQAVLVDKQPAPPKSATVFDPLTARYLDLEKPVKFPVALARDAPRGPQSVEATVIYFYCSQREAWCRRGSADLEVAVDVP